MAVDPKDLSVPDQGGGGGRRGRPPAKVPGTAIMTWVPISTADKLARMAHRHGVSVSSLVRDAVVLRLKEPQS